VRTVFACWWIDRRLDREGDAEEPRPKRRVQRHSPARLVRHPVTLPGGVTVSAEKHKGRLVI
jgi:hypothetical protein